MTFNAVFGTFDRGRGFCRRLVAAAALALAVSGSASAQALVVGERHLTTTDATAALRDAERRADVRVTIWYPAADGAVDQRIDLGPPAHPLFLVGAVAPNAGFADGTRRPIILLSHGFGGSARMMGWFGVELARAGYVVVAVDHPGNNGMDKMTVAGAVLTWDRVQDLQAALNAVASDAMIGPHVDPHRLAVAGFSAGGFTALAAAGARLDVQRMVAFCRAHPNDGVCAPQTEFPLSFEEGEQRVLATPELSAEAAHAADDRRIPEIKAVFVMAPALVQAFLPEKLAELPQPVALILGDADLVATPDTNGLAVARLLPGSTLKVLPGVGHYDFLSVCTPAGKIATPLCAAGVPQEETHRATLEMALAFFGKTLAH